MVPLGAGSASDIMARVVSDQLSRQLNRTFVVENRPGAGGTIGAAAVARSAPDGYTVLAYGALATANALYSQARLRHAQRFRAGDRVRHPAAGDRRLARQRYKTLADLIAAGKAKPGSLNYSSAGAGSASHFAGERLRVSAGIQAQHVPFKGAGRGGDRGRRRPHRLQPATADDHAAADQRRQARRRSRSARTSASPPLPNVPTTIEAGLDAPTSIYPFYSGFFLPAKTPRAIVDKLHAEAAKAIQTPEVQARFAKLGVEPMPMTVDQFAKFFREDVAAALALVKAANIPRQ